MKRDDGPTYEEVVREILTAAGGPVPVDKLVDEVLDRKATVSKNPRQLVKSKLREFVGRLLIYLDADHVLAVPLAYQGAWFRIRLDQESINQRGISVESFEYFLPRMFMLEKIQILDSAGLPTQQTLFGVSLHQPRYAAFDSRMGLPRLWRSP